MAQKPPFTPFPPATAEAKEIHEKFAGLMAHPVGNMKIVAVGGEDEAGSLDGINDIQILIRRACTSETGEIQGGQGKRFIDRCPRGGSFIQPAEKIEGFLIPFVTCQKMG